GADPVEVLQRQSDRIHDLVAAFTWFDAPVFLHLLPQRGLLRVSGNIVDLCLELWNSWGRIRRTHTEEISQYPLAANDCIGAVRLGCGRQKSSFAKKSPTVL